MEKRRQHKKIRRLSRFLLICLVSVSPCLRVNATGNLIVYDLIPDLDSYLRIAPAERESRARLFAQLLIQPHPEIYDRLQIYKTDIATLEQYLDGLQAYLPAIEHIHQRFEEQSDSIQSRFLRAFPDFDSSRAKIYLMLSLFRFDGRVPHDDPRILLLGLDGLAKFHGAEVCLPVILSHELFHLYHFQLNPPPRDADQIELYRLIWQEGLATYVSQVLNPGATLADALLDPRLAAEGPKFIPILAHSLLTQLESTDDTTTGLYLSYQRGGRIPARMGYLIGYEIARRVAAAHQMTELVRLRGHALLSVVRQETQALSAEGSH
jgi:Predicted Zn-dependent protease (DUF2268)